MSVRVSIPHAAVRALDEMARRRGLTRAQALLRAIGIAEAHEAAAFDGLTTGAGQREALERVIVGPKK